MGGIFANSFICQALVSLAAALRGWWRQGAICRAITWLRQNFRQSRAYRAWLAWGGPDNLVENSVYARALHALGRGLERVGDWLRESLFYRLLAAIRDGYLKISANSRVLSAVNRLSLRQWLLAAFGFYLPVEYLIRDTLHLTLVSAVWEEAFIILALGLVLWRRALRQTTALRRETGLDAWLLLFFSGGFLLMSLVRPYPEVALPGYRIVVQYLLWYFIILRLLENDRDFQVLYGALLAVAVIITLHGIYQYIIGVEIPAHWVSQTEMGVRTRVFSLTGSPNIMGSLLVLTAPLAAAGIYYCKRPLVKFLCFALVGLMLLALLFTFSRGAWIGMIVAVLIFALFADKRLIALMGLAAAGVLVFVPSITSRITYLFTQDFAEASAIGGRAMRWETGRLLLTENNPWFGYGLGRFGGAVAMNNQLLDETETFRYFYMDNYYLKTMVEMGYLGLICYLLLLLALVWLGVKAIQKSDKSFALNQGEALTRAVGNKRLLAVGIFSGMLGVLTHCLFENIFEEPYMTAYFWGMAAMLIYLGFFRQSQDKQTQEKEAR